MEFYATFPVANPSLLGERVPDMPLLNMSSGKMEGLHSILQVCYSTGIVHAHMQTHICTLSGCVYVYTHKGIH